jgi:hypothetical protein
LQHVNTVDFTNKAVARQHSYPGVVETLAIHDIAYEKQNRISDQPSMAAALNQELLKQYVRDSGG